MPRVFLPAVLSSVLLWAAFFPLNLGALGFVALVPWLTLVRAEVPRRRRYLAAYAGGFVFSALATNWVRVAHPMMYFSWAAFSLVLPLFWVLALDLIRRLDRCGLPLGVAVPVVWVALEYMRMHFPTGYPFLKPLGLYQMIGFGWYFLGYTQHANLWLIQIADAGGVYAVSFVVGAVHGTIADWLFRCGAVRRLLRENATRPVPSLRPILAGTLVTLVLVIGGHGYGALALQHPTFGSGPRIAALQGNIPQSDKMLKGETLASSYGMLWRKAMHPVEKPDLVVWPETCFPDDWLEVEPGQSPSADFARAADLCARDFAALRTGASVLLGLNALVWEDGKPWKYNSAILLDREGRKLARYDKMHLVPFGEYVPFGETLPFLQWFTPYEKSYACRPGEHWTRFKCTTANGAPFSFACLICYEDSDPYLARQYVLWAAPPDAPWAPYIPPVDFFVNISNDGWFNGTEEHEEHLAICRFRAVETRRAIVRAVNMGISGVIDPDGRVVALPRPTWSSSKQIEEVVTQAVPVDTRGSLYARLGDWVAAGCWIVIVVGVAVGFLWPSAASPR